MMRLKSIVLVGLLFAPLAHPHAQTNRTTTQAAPSSTRPPEPDRSSATFGDWTLRCEQRVAEAATPAVRHCELVQAVQDQSGKPVAQFAIGRVSRTHPWRLVAMLPVNLTLTEPGRLTLGGGRSANGQAAIEMTLRACGPNGCLADVLPDAALVARLRGLEQQGSLAFRDATNTEVQMPFSTRGLAVAWAALEREGA